MRSVGDPAWVGTVAVVAAVTTAVWPLLDRWVRPARTPSGLETRGRRRDLEARTPRADAHELEATPWPTGLRGTSRVRPRLPVAPAEVATWLDDLARSTRAGASITTALVDTPGGGALEARTTTLRRRLRAGDSLADAVTGWRDRLHPHDESLEAAATVLLVAEEVGGSFAVPLERAAAMLRRRAADEDERSSWSSQARLSARVMAALPLAVLSLLVVIDDQVASTITSPVGGALVGLGLLLDTVGFLWMRRIVERAGR